jgi:signal transduction histidine kinase
LKRIQNSRLLVSIRDFSQSIRFRLALWSGAIVAIILLAFCIFIYYRQARDLEMVTLNELRGQTVQLSGAYRLSESAEVNSTGNTSAPVFTLSSRIPINSLDQAAILSLSGEVLQKTSGFSNTALTQVLNYWLQNDQTATTMIYPSSSIQPGLTANSYMYLASPLVVEHTPIAIIILGRPVDPNGQLKGLIVSLLLGGLGTFAFALLGGYWLAGRAMAPVRTITRTAREIGEADLNRRLHLGRHDELGELADTFDGMLGRLQAAFNRQRQFTADASHELRTPLTIVGLQADQALERRRSPDEYEHALQVIHSENEFMAALVNDLLTLARMDAGQTQLRFEPLDVSDIALDVVERLSPLANHAHVEIEIEDLPEVIVQGDRQYLSQMMINLIENAIKYAGGEGHKVKVSGGTRNSGGKNWGWVRVEDDGPGIPAEHLSHLFDRFYRVDQARTRGSESEHGKEYGEGSPSGSGLGLSIVDWIVKAHNGQIDVHSELGKGTTFEVDLPLKK